MAFFSLSSNNSAPVVVHRDIGLPTERVSLRLSDHLGSLSMSRDEAITLLADLTSALFPNVASQAAE